MFAKNGSFNFKVINLLHIYHFYVAYFWMSVGKAKNYISKCQVTFKLDLKSEKS